MRVTLPCASHTVHVTSKTYKPASSLDLFLHASYIYLPEPYNHSGVSCFAHQHNTVSSRSHRAPNFPRIFHRNKPCDLIGPTRISSLGLLHSTFNLTSTSISEWFLQSRESSKCRKHRRHGLQDQIHAIQQTQ